MAEQLPIRTRGFPVPYEGGPPPVPPPPFAGEPAGDGDGAGMDWRRYLAAVLRFKWLVLAVTVLGTAAGVVASRFLPADVPGSGDDLGPGQRRPRVGAVGRSNSPRSSPAMGWIELIKTSFVVLDDVVRDLRLYLSPTAGPDSLALSTLGLKQRFVPGRYELDVATSGATFALRNAQGITIQQGRVGDSVGPDLGLAWVPPHGSLRPGQKIGFAVLPPRDAALRLQQELSVQLQRAWSQFPRPSPSGNRPRARGRHHRTRLPRGSSTPRKRSPTPRAGRW